MRLTINEKWNVHPFIVDEESYQDIRNGKWEELHEYKEFSIGWYMGNESIILCDKIENSFWEIEPKEYTWEKQQEMIDHIDKAIKAFEYQQKHQLSLF